MPVTRANLQQMLNAIQDLNDALPQARSVGNQTEDALAAVKAAWRSPTAAPAFYQHLQTWQDDHNTLNVALDSLLQALSDAHTDLLRKEHNLTA